MFEPGNTSQEDEKEANLYENCMKEEASEWQSIVINFCCFQ